MTDDNVFNGVVEFARQIQGTFGGFHPVIEDVEGTARGINQRQGVLHDCLCLFVWIYYRKMPPLNLTII